MSSLSYCLIHPELVQTLSHTPTDTLKDPETDNPKAMRDLLSNLPYNPTMNAIML